MFSAYRTQNMLRLNTAVCTVRKLIAMEKFTSWAAGSYSSSQDVPRSNRNLCLSIVSQIRPLDLYAISNNPYWLEGFCNIL
jgi:hypothetical protein